MDKKYSSSDLIVGVTYYSNRSDSVKECCQDYEEWLNLYIDKLDSLNKNGIKKGNTAEVLIDYITQVKRAKNIIKEIGKMYSKQILSFLEDIDKADDILFTNKGRKILTDEEFNNAKAFTRIEFSWQNFGAWLTDRIFGDAARELSDEDSKLSKRVQELNNLTKSDLSEIQGDLKNVDKKYSGIFRNICKELIYYRGIIQKLSNIVSPTEFNFNKGNISELKDEINTLNDFLKLIKVDPDYSKVSESDVKFFSDNVDGYFDKSVNGINSICEDSLANLFLTDFEKYRATVNAAKDYFNSYSIDYSISKDKFDSIKYQVDEMLGLYDQYGAEWVKYSNNENTELFNKIVCKFGDINKESNKYIDVWYQLFFDMTASKEALNRFKNSCDLSNENVNKALERIEELYDKDIDAYLAETFEEFEKSAIEKGRKAASEIIVNSLKSKNRIVGKLCDEIFSNAFSEMPAVAEYEWVESTNKAFNNAVQKLRDMSPNDDGFNESVKTVKETFSAAKDAQLDFYKKMASLTDDKTEKEYYEYCVETIENASMNDFCNLDIMYKSQYDGSNYNPLTDLTY